MNRRTQLEQIVNIGVESFLKNLHTSMPGLVVSFNPTKQTASIQPGLKRKLGGKVDNLPLLESVPVRYFRSKKFSIQFPLEVDDEVMLIFQERSIDTWLEKGGTQDPFDVRKHNLSDAIAVPFCYSEPLTDSNFDGSNLQIKLNTGGAVITVKANGDIEIEGGKITLNSGTETSVRFGILKQVIDVFIDALNTELNAVSGQIVSLGGSATHSVDIPFDITTSESDTIEIP